MDENYHIYALYLCAVQDMTSRLEFQRLTTQKVKLEFGAISTGLCNLTEHLDVSQKAPCYFVEGYAAGGDFSTEV